MAPSPAAAREFEQNLLNAPTPRITVETLWETDLTADKLTAHLESAQRVPRPVGLAGGYTSAGKLTVLAVAVGSNVLLVRLRNAGKVANLDTARTLLKDELLCSAANLLHAFDMHTLALSLYSDARLPIANAIDIQSACTCDSNRVVANAVEFAMTSTKHSGIYRANIDATFGSEVWDERKPSPLAFKAWLAGYIPLVGDMELRLAQVGRIDTGALHETKLEALAGFMRSDQRLDAMKPGKTKHEFRAVNATNDKFMLQSERYQTRVQGRDGPVRMSVTDQYGAQYTVSGTAKDVQGRIATVKAAGIMAGKVVGSVQSTARAAASSRTMAERDKDATILAMLQGTSKLFESPFLKTMYPGDQEVVWPESLPTLPDQLPVAFDQKPLNSSQEKAVLAMLALNNNSRITIIQGPPGTGKTTVITAYVHSACSAGQAGIWLVAQSNVAVKNIAEKLISTSFEPWKLLVAKDFHFDWHEHLYKTINSHIIRSDDFRPASKELAGCKVILCTLSMLSHPNIHLFTAKIPVKVMVVDEASQIAISGYIPPLNAFPSLQKLCFIGDDKQLPPYGQEQTASIQSIFEISHLRDQAIFLDTQYRMPVTIGSFISKAVYDGQLQSCHKITGPACFFVDVSDGKEKRSGTSWENIAECHAACKIAAKLQEEEEDFRIITPYDAQRNALENTLKTAGVPWQNKCFNVDSFQGNEEDNIIISLVRSSELGFLNDLRRTNVMLSRCKKAMFICTSWDFLVAGKGAKSLVGRMAEAYGDVAWVSMQDVEDGNF
ncbi:AAA domain-containing protein [Phanerochaete sordida]|uniref:AAA domain-containing protein n=1 Tax=Phanerochaete sordida TaxID=48140 RepID=A0A9P3G5E8_9APHY|nr:AAA domain-containing protein [Phanerochaete sordida]